MRLIHRVPGRAQTLALLCLALSTMMLGCARPGSEPVPESSPTVAILSTLTLPTMVTTTPIVIPLTPMVTPSSTPTSVLPTATEALPTPTRSSTTHTVRAGETLLQIALLYDTTIDAIIDANNIDDADLIRVGQELVIPR